MKTIVLGVWGEGTSLAAEIVRQHGVWLGGGWHGPDKRNKHGTLEDAEISRALIGTEPERFVEALARLDGFKHPRLLVNPWSWELVEHFPFRVVWVWRPSKREDEYTMLAHLQEEACRNRQLLRKRWADVPSFDLFFEALIERPEDTTRELAAFLGVPHHVESVELVDPSWPRAERRKAGIRELD